MKKLIALIAFFALLVPAFAAPVPTVSVPTTRNTGDTITAAIWNNDVGNIYAYINNNLAPALNVLTTTGDIYGYTGSALVRVGVGSNTQVLTANSGAAAGIDWEAFANAAPLTTKGDLLTTNGSASTRLPVGADGTVLLADSTQTLGLKYGTVSTVIPSGSVVAWSPHFAGTNTIPSGWLLCDGTNGTPNLIGLFIVGARPSGSGSAANASGFGLETVDALGNGAVSHNHFIATQNANTGTPSATISVGSGSGNTVASSSHTHTFSYGNIFTSVTSSEPADYALCYIMKS